MTENLKRLFLHLSQSPDCGLLHTTSHDPEQWQLQLIDDTRLGRSSVAALPTARADNDVVLIVTML
jgi:hypothetical protein